MTVYAPQLWDLTAGKLMHDFKYHDGQVQCLDFHPHEFLLATGRVTIDELWKTSAVCNAETCILCLGSVVSLSGCENKLGISLSTVSACRRD